MNITTSVRGKIAFELINRSGLIVQSGECTNLITDAGLDHCMASGGLSTMAAYIAVGTGTRAPAVTDVSLEREVARTSQRLGLVPSEGATRYGGGHWSMPFGVAFDYNEANGNLTEFGASDWSSGAMLTRSLFKDASGNPIVITKTNETRLVIYYKLEIFITPNTPTRTSINIDGIGAVEVDYIMTERADGYFGFGSLELFRGRGGGIMMFTEPMNMSQTDVSGSNDTYGGFESYTAGTFTRNVSGERPPESNDVTIYGYALGYNYGGIYNSNTQTYMKVKFVNPIVKGKDYRLKLSASYSITRNNPAPVEL